MFRGRLRAGRTGPAMVVAAAWLSATAAPPSGAAPGWAHDVAAARATFEGATGRPLRPGFRIEPTVFPHYYALRSEAHGRTGTYFRDDMQWTANVRSAGWSRTGPAEADALARWQREQAAALPLERLIRVQRRTPFVAVVWSAPDCPYCRRLEAWLEAEGVSVYVVPVGLGDDGFRQAARAWCATDPAAAWRAALRVAGSRPDGEVPERKGCVYPRDTMVDIGFFVGQGRLATPIVVFADGTRITGWDDHQGPARLRAMLDRKLFFPVR